MFKYIYFGAAGFAALAGLYAASPRWRSVFQRVFKLPKPKNQAEISAFDSLRGMLALWVALFHANHWLAPANDPGTRFIIGSGPLAVNTFVMLSGFLIYRSVSKVSSAVELYEYFQRRFFRIYPLYIFSLLLIFGGNWVSGADRSGSDVWANVFMLRLFGWERFANPPAWSLYVEEGFYILLPLWVKLFRSRVLLYSSLFYALFFIPALYSREVGLLPYFCLGIFSSHLLKHNTGGWFQDRGYFFAGAALLAADLALQAGLAGPPGFSGGLSVLNKLYPVLLNQLYALSWLFIICSIASVKSVNRLLGVYPLRVLGIISYSIYLMHGLIITAGTPVGFNGAGGLSGSAGVAGVVHGPLLFYPLYLSAIVFYSCVTYAFVEYPFLRLRNVPFHLYALERLRALRAKLSGGTAGQN